MGLRAAPGHHRRDRQGAGIVVQVRLLDDSLAARLQAATTPGTAVRLGAGHYRVRGPAQMTAHATWPELRRWPGTRAWQVRFLTPACARRRNRTSPLLAPDALARGLAERWQQLDPATAPGLTWRGTGPVWVSDLDGHSEVQILSRRVHRGGGPPRQGRSSPGSPAGSVTSATTAPPPKPPASTRCSPSPLSPAQAPTPPTGSARSLPNPPGSHPASRQPPMTAPLASAYQLHATLTQVASPDQLEAAWDDVLATDRADGVLGPG